MHCLRAYPRTLVLGLPSARLFDCEAQKMGGSLMRSHSLRFNSKYSDLQVTCNYQQWSVHKAIVCSRSGFFDGACSSQFREGNTGVIDLSEDDEEAVGHMINCKQ